MPLNHKLHYLLVVFVSVLVTFNVSAYAASTDTHTITNTGQISYAPSDPYDPPGQDDPTGQGVTYFECTFASPQGQWTEGVNFGSREPCGYVPEKGLWHWMHNEGFVGLAEDPGDPSRSALRCTMPAGSGTGAAKCYELQGRDASNYGNTYTATKEAYWHFKVYFPSSITVSGWRLFFQLCGEEGVFGQAAVNPHVQMTFYNNVLNVRVDDYYWSNRQDHDYQIGTLSGMPKDQWVDFVVYMKQGSGFRVEDGTLTVWQDGVKVLDRSDLPTATPSGTPFIVWGPGCYGSRQGTDQTIYFKDIYVTSESTLAM